MQWYTCALFCFQVSHPVVFLSVNQPSGSEIFTPGGSFNGSVQAPCLSLKLPELKHGCSALSSFVQNEKTVKFNDTSDTTLCSGIRKMCISLFYIFSLCTKSLKKKQQEFTNIAILLMTWKKKKLNNTRNTCMQGMYELVSSFFLVTTHISYSWYWITAVKQ